jgi:hypothetical protein
MVTYLSCDAAYTVSPDAMPITAESSLFSLSHQVDLAYFSRKGRTRVLSSNCPRIHTLVLMPLLLH